MAVDFSIIGDRIKRARKAQNMTQEDLAEKMDVSIAFLSRIERGGSQVNLKRLGQICGILGISEGEILNGTSNNSSKYLDSEFSALLETCTPEQQKLIYDIAKVIANKK
jgi:transcriptional regulator with XRE-family HTH domain